MNRSTLNLIATICFAIAAIAFLVSGTTILGLLFVVLAVLSVIQVYMDRVRSSR